MFYYLAYDFSRLRSENSVAAPLPRVDRRQGGAGERDQESGTVSRRSGGTGPQRQHSPHGSRSAGTDGAGAATAAAWS